MKNLDLLNKAEIRTLQLLEKALSVSSKEAVNSSLSVLNSILEEKASFLQNFRDPELLKSSDSYAFLNTDNILIPKTGAEIKVKAKERVDFLTSKMVELDSRRAALEEKIGFSPEQSTQDESKRVYVVDLCAENIATLIKESNEVDVKEEKAVTVVSYNGPLMNKYNQYTWESINLDNEARVFRILMSLEDESTYELTLAQIDALKF